MLKLIALVMMMTSCSPAATRAATPHAAPVPLEIHSGEVAVGDTRLHYEIAGTGPITIVLESGLGDGLRAWDDVFPSLARFARVIRYDRAGYGQSAIGNQPRTLTQIATDLHGLLHGIGAPPPYVLVGHSLGGFIVRGFAHLYPDELAGLVLVDPATESFIAKVPKEILAEEGAHQERLLQGSVGGMAEWKQMHADLSGVLPELTSFGALPDVPTMLLIAGRDRPPGWATGVLERYEPWVEHATAGYMMMTADSSHYIQRDEPAAVVTAVRRIIHPNALARLRDVIARDGVAAGVSLFRRMKTEYPPEYLGDRVLNTLGYQQLSQHHVAEAIELFELNVEMFPDHANPYDSLGEAYVAAGDREHAIASYKKSYELDPDNTNARDMLEKLEHAR